MKLCMKKKIHVYIKRWRRYLLWNFAYLLLAKLLLLIVSYHAVPVIERVVKMKFLVLLSIFGEFFSSRVLIVSGISSISVKPMKDKLGPKHSVLFLLKTKEVTEAAHQKCSCEKVFWKDAANVQENSHAEIALRQGCSPVNLLNMFWKPFPKNTSRGLLLK